MLDMSFEEGAHRWIRGFIEWENSDSTELYGCEYWEDKDPPYTKNFYRPWKPEEATWFQYWETTSEGTPISPPFETMEELLAWIEQDGESEFSIVVPLPPQ